MLAATLRRCSRIALRQQASSVFVELDLLTVASSKLPLSTDETFRQALLNGFAPVVSREGGNCFCPSVHNGNRQTLVNMLKNCRLESPEVFAHAESEELTRIFLKQLWAEAVKVGLAVDQEGLPMRAAAAEVTKSFLSKAEKQAESSRLTENGEPTWRPTPCWLSKEALKREHLCPPSPEDFEEDILPFWREQLARVDRVTALKLVPQLGGDNRFGWLRHKASGVPTGLFEEALQWKAELPECVLLVQVGDFFEAWGVDAVMLVQWCGLNPMSRKPRAGFPISAELLQRTLDSLIRADLSVAVIVQVGTKGNAKKVPRLVRQVVSPGAPTYLHGHELKRSGDAAAGEFSEGRPYVAMRLRSDGLLYAEIRPFKREIRFREGVTPEGVEALLEENEGVAWPVLVGGPRRSFLRANQWKWFPKHRKWLPGPSEMSDADFLEACCREVCSSLRLPEDPPFVKVCLDTRDSLQPLSVTTARNLGVLLREGVPSLVSHMLPPDAPAFTKRLCRRWLCAPRSPSIVQAMRELLQCLLSDGSLCLPTLHRLPALAKVLAYISAKSASERLFRDLRECCTGMIQVFSEVQFKAIWPPLLEIVAADVGETSLDRLTIVGELQSITSLIDEWVHDERISDEAAVGIHVSDDDTTQRSVERFLEANEMFRGVASQKQPLVEEAYERVQVARIELCNAIKEGLPDEQNDSLIYSIIDNDICYRQKPLKNGCSARDRKGKTKQHRYTTKRLEAAMDFYGEAVRAAQTAVQDALSQLSAELRSFVLPMRAAIGAAEILVTAHRHVSHTSAARWQLPALVEGSSFDALVAPYWLERGDAVVSRVKLSSLGAIATGPNMAGKSTLMRALGASALLANCGFLCPCHSSSRIPRYRQVFFLAADGDRPSEGVSAFGYEALQSATLLQRACPGTLALVDEFGRGTEPRAAEAAVCALLEELSARGTHFVLATHLHGVADIQLKLPGRSQPSFWRMGMSADLQEPRWTYKLEEGICRDSFAWHTLKKFGWSDSALERFHGFQQLQRDLVDAEPKASSTSEALSPSSESSSKDVAMGSGLKATATLLADVCSKDPASVVRLRPESMPPASISAGKAVVYVLVLESGSLYVGQTDHLHARLATHRRRFGSDLHEILLLGVKGTAEARRCETLLQRRLLREGSALLSSHDFRNLHFGLEESDEEEDFGNTALRSVDSPCSEDAEQLRRSAKILLDLAEKLAKDELKPDG
eukprot:CAMPEP_0197632712 /NCGR_PEP_ID=MMETSP1338-20131121/9325_1 /TAXON_ID=43686 ORGANISM="Pelagodinium beii, Strain RCC1491" /NCGR_SAMPLE_ID=MMETSP1338 /ASSEMBLY_ACC=CAM_ASM_000754 /LENGTH=1225 /DNA_ID=CAMNT_0043204279 /DNA_START=145 /DNA_END=3822 /DNA_ORIENTATION=+